MSKNGEVISSTADSEKLKEKNLLFFKENEPVLYHQIVNAPELSSQLSFVDNKIDNVFVNGTPFYGKPVQEYCENQMKDFWDDPERLIFTNINHCNPSEISRGMMKKIDASPFISTKDLDAGIEPVIDIGYCFVVGLGLGQHIAELIEKKIARNILIIEPVFEFFIQSLSLIDWEKMYADGRENGVGLWFFFENNPMDQIEHVESRVRKIGNTFLDGSYFLVHYPSWETQETYRLLRERLKSYYITSGFFEDELVMMRNCYENLSFSDFRFIKRKKYLHQDYPVFVLASGPSLEFDLENVKKMRDKIILVSSGTTLLLLLKEGIRPDFHAEIENVETVYDFMKPKYDEYGFEGITLLASTTVHPKVPTLFDEVYYYVRGGISSSTVLCSGIGDLNEVAPFSANAAASAIATLGFRNIYLVGVDCGRYVGAGHHAAGSVYDEIGISDLMEESLNYGRRVPGNFGGEVTTTVLLDMSRRTLAGLSRRLNLNMFNCSHGARIDFTKPLSSGAIKLTNEPNMQQHIKKVLRDQSKLYVDGEYIDHTALQKNVDGCAVFKKNLAEFIAECRKKITNFYDFDRAYLKFWNENWDELGHLMIIMGGSFSAMIRLGAFLGCRIKNEEERKEYLELFMTVYEEQCVWMTDVLYDFYGEMASGKKGIEIPADYVLEDDLAKT